MDIEIVNLTPHPITVTSGLHEGVYPPSGRIARVDRLPSGTIIDLPDPSPGRRYIVSVIVAEAAIVKKEERNDLFCPGEQVRDAAGRIIGCRDLVHPRHASPAAAELLSRISDDKIRERIAAVLAAGRGSDLDAAIAAGYEAGDLVQKVTVFTPSHQGVYRAGWAEGLAVAAVRARFAGQHRLAEALAAAAVDPCAGQPQWIEDVSVPTPRTRWRVDWSEGGCRRTGYLESDGWRWWLSLELPLRPLYVTEEEAADIRASQTSEYELLWRAERRGERLADRRAALAAQLRQEAEALHRRAAEVERAPSSEIDVEDVEGEAVEAVEAISEAERLGRVVGGGA